MINYGLLKNENRSAIDNLFERIDDLVNTGSDLSFDANDSFENELFGKNIIRSCEEDLPAMIEAIEENEEDSEQKFMHKENQFYNIVLGHKVHETVFSLIRNLQALGHF